MPHEVTDANTSANMLGRALFSAVLMASALKSGILIGRNNITSGQVIIATTAAIMTLAVFAVIVKSFISVFYEMNEESPRGRRPVRALLIGAGVVGATYLFVKWQGGASETSDSLMTVGMLVSAGGLAVACLMVGARFLVWPLRPFGFATRPPGPGLMKLRKRDEEGSASPILSLDEMMGTS